MFADAVRTLLFYLFSGACLLVASLFFYVVLYKTPPKMWLFRNTIVNLAIWYMLSALNIGLILQPSYESHNSTFCVHFHGLIKHHSNALYMFIFICFLCCGNAMAALIACFVFRCAQVRTSGSFPVLVVTALLHGGFLLFSGTFGFLILFTDHAYITGEIYLCFDEDHQVLFNRHFVIVTVASVGIAGVIVFLTFLTLRTLRARKSSMTAKTYKLHVLLVVNLVILVVLPVVFDIIPIVVLAPIIYFDSSYIYISLSIADYLPFFDVILSISATLIFVTPYRQSLRRMLWKEHVIRGRARY
uniref:G_PROTEIN_RECEP_F1_2 domain-containing protein n=1 Tax=Steinernema glaseri TaxID=37863 RepID=A0A1I7Z2C4_9BILA